HRAGLARSDAGRKPAPLPASGCDVRARGPLLGLLCGRRAAGVQRARGSDRAARGCRDRAPDRTRTARALGACNRVDTGLQRHPAAERNTCAMRILVAEDETIIRHDLRDLLERAGFEVCAEARARHDELQALREEAESLTEALAARKVIERAKGLLMTKENLTEQEAFERLRKASQVSQRPLKVIAEAVVPTLGGEA